MRKKEKEPRLIGPIIKLVNRFKRKELLLRKY
ncbi:hypothetical protein LACR_1379 [Lactococcus cremoris subsp. cremoris SK11]|uniref:Uncharacterized protein n=2 Tax=Lactococcus cremoris subsp. cremoris TaxID=2816960 RepID=T0VHZ0_LACLC|nr:hypothetical protein LACR_1379 [Lactococcus cremoris subsp. cremoris SK11]EQC82635.1 hypothetical protein LLT7_01205 [Lactococcus cremoris subsp. cremoris TIFN7]EQC95442.1 hypothetical protein LLT3_08760 [Lactococcus cremoris subsp. cremoris TIFN3]